MSDLLEPEVDAPAKKITSHDIKLGLRTSIGKGCQVFFEVGNDTGTKVTRHADAVAIGIWPSTGHQIHGYEIKVSRGDFLNEMKQPEKSWPVMRFCHRWTLLTPPGLVKVDELPPNWGLQTFDGRILRTVKQAPLMQPEALSGGFVAALVRRAGEADDALLKAATDKAIHERGLYVNTAVERAKADWERMGDYRARDEAERLAKFEEVFGKLSKYDIERAAPILKAIMEKGADRVMNSLEFQHQRLSEAATTLKAALDAIPSNPS